jgi:hypothetical protein
MKKNLKISMYISAEQIQVIGYSGDKNIEHFVTHSLPEGAMYNGTIMDAALLTECLVSLKRDNPGLLDKGVYLVVDGSSVLSRRMVVPKLHSKQYLQLVRDEFVESIGDVNDLVCGYCKMSSAENAILGCAVNKVMVDRYTSIFEEAEIKLNSIRIGVELLLDFVKSKAELQKSTVVLNVLDGLTMLSMIFVDGDNIFMSRSRLYGEEKEQVFGNVIESLNGLIQFVQSQNHGDITASYYLGVSKADVQLLAARNPHSGIRIDTFVLNENVPPQAHFAGLNMYFGNRKIELLEARKQLDRYIEKKRKKKVWIPILAAYGFIVLAAAGFLRFEIYRTIRDIHEINDYITSPVVTEKRQELNRLTQRINHYNDIVRQIGNKEAWEARMPSATRDLLDFIIFNHGIEVNVTSFDFNQQSGIVRVAATAPDARYSVDYVDILYEHGVAENVNYQGYGSGAGGVFHFSVDIKLLLDTDETED